jgi:hypothetical protein
LVAELLRSTRRLFLEMKDPTFMAYILYGDAQLSFEAPAPHL